LAEALDPSGGIHELLLTRVVRVAFSADFHVNGRVGRPRLERIAARTLNSGAAVLGMDSGFHDVIPRFTASKLNERAPAARSAEI
jgi:hypothetical protein